MTSAVLSAAQTAVALKTGLDDLDQTPQGELKGANGTHWSFKLFIAASIVGVIAAVVAAIFLWYAAAVCGLLLAATNCCAAIYIKRFGVLKNLEEYTAVLAEKVNAFAQKIGLLKKANEDLGKINEEFSKIPKNWASEIEEGKNILEEKTQALAVTAQKLERAEEKLQKLGTVVAAFQQEAGNITASVLAFSQDNKLFTSNVGLLQGYVTTFQENTEELVGNISYLDAENDQTDEILKTYHQHNLLLKTLFETVKEMYEQVKQSMDRLKLKVDGLGKIVPSAEMSAAKVEEIINRCEALMSQVEKMPKYREGYKKWKALIKSDDYASFLSWKINQEKGE